MVGISSVLCFSFMFSVSGVPYLKVCVLFGSMSVNSSVGVAFSTVSVNVCVVLLYLQVLSGLVNIAWILCVPTCFDVYGIITYPLLLVVPSHNKVLPSLNCILYLLNGFPCSSFKVASRLHGMLYSALISWTINSGVGLSTISNSNSVLTLL